MPQIIKIYVQDPILPMQLTSKGASTGNKGLSVWNRAHLLGHLGSRLIFLTTFLLCSDVKIGWAGQALHKQVLCVVEQPACCILEVQAQITRVIEIVPQCRKKYKSRSQASSRLQPLHIHVADRANWL